MNEYIGKCISPKYEAPKNPTKTEKDKVLVELVEWLNSERYLIDNKSDTLTEEFEKEHQWELSRNRMIDKTIKKILELSFD